MRTFRGTSYNKYSLEKAHFLSMLNYQNNTFGSKTEVISKMSNTR